MTTDTAQVLEIVLAAVATLGLPMLAGLWWVVTRVLSHEAALSWIRAEHKTSNDAFTHDLNTMTRGQAVLQGQLDQLERDRQQAHLDVSERLTRIETKVDMLIGQPLFVSAYDSGGQAPQNFKSLTYRSTPFRAWNQMLRVERLVWTWRKS